MIENREWRRVEVDFEAECSCLNMPQEKFKVHVVNITVNGLCFSAPASVHPCHKMLMTFEVKGEGKITLEVKTVWSGYFEKPAEYRTGVKIAQAAPDDHDKFLRFYHQSLVKQSTQK